MVLHKYCFNFQKENLTWPITNILFIFINYPLEIIIFSYLFGQVFSLTQNIDKNFNKIIKLIGYIIGAYIFLELFNLFKDRIDAYYYPKLEHNIRLQMVDLIFNKININYDSINNGEYVSRLLKIPLFLGNFYERFNKWFLPFVITILGVTIYLFFINVNIGLISILAFLIYSFSFYQKSKIDINNSKDRENKENKLLEEIDDSLNNCFSIITSSRTVFEKNRLDKLHNILDSSVFTQQAGHASFRAILGILNIGVFAILSFYTLYLFKKRKISNASAISIIILVVFVIKQIKTLIPRSCELVSYYGHIKENDSFIASLIKDTVLDGKIDKLNILGNIEFQNVTFKYPGSTQLALDNVSFKANSGENIAVIGKSASGKTSIIKLLLGFYVPDSGNIYIDGVDVKDINRSFLRNNISIVHQNVRLFNRSVLHNIAFGTKYTIPEIKEKLKNLKVMQVFDTLPNGLDTIAGKFGDKLSGGQKQIVYMLRCYFRENPIILLDEPTSAVDKYHKKFVLEMIEELSKNSTCIIVSHDPSIYKSDLFPKKFGIDLGVLKPLR